MYGTLSSRLRTYLLLRFTILNVGYCKMIELEQFDFENSFETEKILIPIRCFAFEFKAGFA